MKNKTQQNLMQALMQRLGHSSFMSDYVYEQLEKYPQKNSLASYRYILSWMGIENMGVHVSSEILATEIPMPAIVHLNHNGAPFAIVDKIDNSPNISPKYSLVSTGRNYDIVRYQYDLSQIL